MRRGQLLIEVVVAIAVIVTAIVGLVQVTNKSVANSGQSKRQAVATTYATEAMGWVVAQKEILGWSAFSAYGAGAPGRTYCFSVTPPTVWPSAGGCGSANRIGDPAEFLREVTVTNVGAANNEIQIDVTVSWNEGGRTLSSKITNTVTRY